MFPFRAAYRGIKSLLSRKKKAPKRVYRKRKSLKRAVNKSFMVKKTILLDRINVTSNQTQVFTAELTDLPQYTQYIALYDQYKIMKVRVQYRVLNNVNLATSAFPSGVLTLGLIHSCVDSNDSTPPGSIQQIMNDSSYFVTKSNKDHIRTFTPKFLTNVGGSAAAESSRGWLSCDFPNVSHYALKTWFEPGIIPSGFTSYVVEPIITFYVAFKDQKSA